MEQKTYVHTSHIEVRYAETDAMGVVHHASYPIWFEQARIDFFKSIGAPYTEIEKEGFESPVLELVVRYRKSCKFGDTVDIESAITRVNKLKWRFQYRLLVKGELCATATTLHAFTKDGVPTNEKPECFKKVEPMLFPVISKD
ncbi:MAG: acyl-CoA thioesterase [Fibrobacter sp.]|jgi:acyl-CoA thioester hydrolase|uniref:acyl-CoA thioesterase n=1 Tax=Fibrobacter sp. UWP2 TaxID=1896216 RepID=UPI000914F2F1|nr:acyl-CoA thioesterase [Fibrobacter sp. UWP2]MBO7383031.1 acyl-CoA thioesterase [Fibrobacter sp.]MCR5378551.1 acyl-CoA thioesterase [Fibrobacter sp.]SHJ41937.1 acyl-CoA thioester hydrolase [Fibrobacter sp. UWP2]